MFCTHVSQYQSFILSTAEECKGKNNLDSLNSFHLKFPEMNFCYTNTLKSQK